MSFSQTSSGDFADAPVSNLALLARLTGKTMQTETEPTTENLDALDTMELPEMGTPAAKEISERFGIHDAGGADWLLARLFSNQSEAALLKAQTEKRLAQLKADSDRLMGLFGDQLEAFAAAEAQKRRRKTVSLPHGDLYFRQASARIVVTDAEAAFVHARTAFPDAIKQAAPELDKTAYIKAAEAHLLENGDVLPGLDREPGRDKFGIKFPNTKEEAE